MYDVIVVGAGPSGSYIASRLAQLGYRVIVMERKKEAGEDICCTGIISVDCFNTFKLDATIFGQASSAKFFAPSGEFIRLERQNPQAYIVDRATLDRSLKERAQKYGAEYLFSALVAALSSEPNQILVTVESQGKRMEFNAQTVVLACGFSPDLPRKLGLGGIANFAFGAQAEVDTNVDEVEVYFDQELFPGFFGWLVPTSASKGLAGLLVSQKPAFYLDNFLSCLYNRGKISSVADERFGMIPLATLPRSYSDRILIIGDAAGQVKPTTGGGIYYGLLCADVAADCLHQAFLANDFSAVKLSLYEKRWRAKLGSDLKTDYRARHFYQNLSNHQIDHLFQLARDDGIAELVAEWSDFSFDWHRAIILKMLKGLAFNMPIKSIRTLLEGGD